MKLLQVVQALKCENPRRKPTTGITGWILIILLLAALPAFAGSDNAMEEKGQVREKTLSIKELKGDVSEKEKSPESKEPVPAASAPDVEKSKTLPAKEENSLPAGNIKPVSSPEPQGGKTDGIPADTVKSDVKGNMEGETDSLTASPSTPLKDDYLFEKEDKAYTGLKLNFPLYIGSILIVSLITILSIKFLGRYMGIPQTGGAKKSMIKILEKQMLSPNKQFCIVEVPGKTVLIGVTENEMKVLCELDLQNIKTFGENEDKPETAAGGSTNYIVDVLLRRWQGGK